MLTNNVTILLLIVTDVDVIIFVLKIAKAKSKIEPKTIRINFEVDVRSTGKNRIYIWKY